MQSDLKFVAVTVLELLTFNHVFWVFRQSPTLTSSTKTWKWSVMGDLTKATV